MRSKNKIFKLISIISSSSLLVGSYNFAFAGSGIEQNLFGSSELIGLSLEFGSSDQVKSISSEYFQEVEGYNLERVYKRVDRYIGLYENQKTGAKVIVIPTVEDEENNHKFSMFFKSPSENDKGTNHVLEHCILHRFLDRPNLVRGVTNNLGIFYEVSYTDGDSLDILKFDEELGVLLSQLKKPDFLNNKRIFDIESHHEHIGSAGQKFIRGSVFMEMNMRPEFKETERTFMNDSKLKFESGGIPDKILEMEYQEVVDAYKKYHHPSNSISIIESRDYDSIMKQLNDEYFNSYDKKNIDIDFQIKGVNKDPDYRWVATDETKEYCAKIFFDLKDLTAEQVDQFNKMCDIFNDNESWFKDKGYTSFWSDKSTGAGYPYIIFMLKGSDKDLFKEDVLKHNVSEFISFCVEKRGLHNQLRSSYTYYDWYRCMKLSDLIHEAFALYNDPFSEKSFIIKDDSIVETDLSAADLDKELILDTLDVKRIAISNETNYRHKEEIAHCFRFETGCEDDFMRCVTMHTLNDFILRSNLSRKGVFYSPLMVEGDSVITYESLGVEDAIDFLETDLKYRIYEFEVTPEILKVIKFCLCKSEYSQDERIEKLTANDIQKQLKEVKFLECYPKANANGLIEVK